MTRERLRSIAKFQITKSQYGLAFVAVVAILGLGFSSTIASKSTVRQAKVLSNVETPAASIIFTQRETLVYATRLAQWANGGTTRRSVQIARGLLAQRLAVIDTSGKSMGSRAQRNYWRVLRESDRIVAMAPTGVLPESLHQEYSTRVSPLIDEILAEARRLVVSYQRSVDQEFVTNAKETADRDRLNLIFFYIFIIFSGLFLFLNVRTNFKNYRIARKALEAEQNRLDETIIELKRTQLKVAELRDLNEAKNAFISTVNHELRTPLTSIIGYIEIMRDENLTTSSEEQRKYLEVLDRNAQILLHLVESMLSLSKIDAAEGKLPDNKVNLREVIDNAIFIMQPTSESSHIEIDFASEEQLFVQGDSGQLSQVFINLLGNAIKFSPRGSHIVISMRAVSDSDGGESAEISVTDSGIGIPRDDIDHLFTRFFRAKNADSGQYPGTGLGLAIVHQVVTRHRGSIDVSSNLGTGTTFTVTIPLYLNEEARLILNRRPAVLGRAIASLEGATPQTIKVVTHDIGGAIGLYGFHTQGTEILQYSRSLTTDTPDLTSFVKDHARLISLLRAELHRIGGSEDE
ncbi:MAG: sensor histidine kinase [Candidatus Planktophila sp.]